MDIFEQLDPQAILVLLMVIFAGIRAFFDQKKKAATEEVITEEPGLDAYEAYEEELARQQRDLQIEIPPSINPTRIIPPPLTETTPPLPLPSTPARPKLSAAEKQALANLSAQKKASSRRANESTKSRVYRHLASPTAAREALLLAEVLGPPKALQDKR